MDNQTTFRNITPPFILLDGLRPFNFINSSSAPDHSTPFHVSLNRVVY